MSEKNFNINDKVSVNMGNISADKSSEIIFWKIGKILKVNNNGTYDIEMSDKYIKNVPERVLKREVV